MLDIKIDYYDYFEPWIIPYEKRLNILLSGELKVAYFYEEPNNSTFRYRTYNISEVLNRLTGGCVSASYFFLSDLGEARTIADNADLLVVCRSRYSAQLDCLIKKFRSSGKKVLFDIDDLVFDLDYADVLIDSLGLDPRSPQVLDEWSAYIGRMGKSLRLCDGAITTNKFLAERICEFSNRPAVVIPNFLNPTQQQYSAEIFAAKKSGDFISDGRRSIGYFSGSPSHKLDFRIVVPSLIELLDADKSLDLIIVGYIEPDESLTRFSSRIRYYPFQDYVNLQRLIASVDVNLVPLQDNIFTNCKSELKYFEAGVVGVPTVASPVFTYRSSICHGNNGYLARSYQWVDAIQQALDDASSGHEVSEKARIHCLKSYAWEAQLDKIMKAITQFVAI
jgi:glycosyltransferase involved in cell wall biosynthesis